MLPALKSPWFESIFAVYNRNLLARRFEGLRVAGLGHLRGRRGDVPLVLYANHSSWWDGLVAFQLGRACGLDQYAMMEERQLRQYPFFRRLGAFSVVRESPREGARSIEYAARLLQNSGRALWIFPQGETLPNDARPLNFYRGAARVIERAGPAYAAPVAMRYEFLEDYRPEALARVGRPRRVEAGAGVGAKRLTDELAASLTETLDALRADVLAARFDGYEEIVAVRRRRRRASEGRQTPVGRGGDSS